MNPVSVPMFLDIAVQMTISLANSIPSDCVFFYLDNFYLSGVVAIGETAI